MVLTWLSSGLLISCLLVLGIRWRRESKKSQLDPEQIAELYEQYIYGTKMATKKEKIAADRSKIPMISIPKNEFVQVIYEVQAELHELGEMITSIDTALEAMKEFKETIGKKTRELEGFLYGIRSSKPLLTEDLWDNQSDQEVQQVAQQFVDNQAQAQFNINAQVAQATPQPPVNFGNLFAQYVGTEPNVNGG